MKLCNVSIKVYDSLQTVSAANRINFSDRCHDQVVFLLYLAARKATLHPSVSSPLHSALMKIYV